MSDSPSILTGATTNGTFHVKHYDPTLPVPRWHQHMGLATLCVCNTLTLAVIIWRIWYRWVKIKHFRYDDAWMAVAGFFLLPYWASLIGTSYYGGGLHSENISPDYRRMHWHFTPGWAGYYVVASCIKMSVCFCFLEILPAHLQKQRYTAYALSLLIVLLGITMTFSWIFECTPFLSNFLWSVESDSCVNYDIFRWLWIGLSLPIDIAILIIPMQILKKTQLMEHERRVLQMTFSATLLGTITCAIGIYGVWNTRVEVQLDGFYQETPFIMMNCIEIFMYALGASFPVLSRYLVTRAAPSSTQATGHSTLDRRFPNFRVSSLSAMGSSSRKDSMYVTSLGVDSSVKSLQHSDSAPQSIPEGNYEMYDLESQSSSRNEQQQHRMT